MKQKLDEEKVERIKELAEEGKSTSEIAKELGISRVTVWKYLKEEKEEKEEEGEEFLKKEPSGELLKATMESFGIPSQASTKAMRIFEANKKRFSSPSELYLMLINLCNLKPAIASYVVESFFSQCGQEEVALPFQQFQQPFYPQFQMHPMQVPQLNLQNKEIEILKEEIRELKSVIAQKEKEEFENKLRDLKDSVRREISSLRLILKERDKNTSVTTSSGKNIYDLIDVALQNIDSKVEKLLERMPAPNQRGSRIKVYSEEERREKIKKIKEGLKKSEELLKAEDELIQAARRYYADKFAKAKV